MIGEHSDPTPGQDMLFAAMSGNQRTAPCIGDASSRIEPRALHLRFSPAQWSELERRGVTDERGALQRYVLALLFAERDDRDDLADLGTLLAALDRAGLDGDSPRIRRAFEAVDRLAARITGLR